MSEEDIIVSLTSPMDGLDAREFTVIEAGEDEETVTCEAPNKEPAGED